MRINPQTNGFHTPNKKMTIGMKGGGDDCGSNSGIGPPILDGKMIGGDQESSYTESGRRRGVI